MKYRKKPVIIEAVQFIDTYERAQEIEKFIGKDCYYTDEPITGPKLLIRTLEGIVRASLGDYIIKGIDGEFYPCKPDIFNKTYEEIDD